MATTPTTLAVPTLNGGTVLVNADQNGSTYTFHSVPEVAGSAVGPANPLPIGAVVNGALVSTTNPNPVADVNLGTVADAAWAGAGNASVVALLKAAYLAAVAGSKLVDKGGVNQVAINTAGAVSITNRTSVTVTQTVVALTANTDATLLAANPNRKFLGLMNIGTGQATLAFNGAATVNAGWILAPYNNGAVGAGGGLTWDAVVSQDAIHAISATATTIVILEGV